MPQIDRYSAKILNELGRLRREVSQLDTFAISTSPYLYAVDHIKGSSYIWLCAMLEDYINKFCYSLNREINLLGVACHNVTLCLFSLQQDVDFSKLYDVGKIEKYSLRSGILKATNGSELFVLDESIAPLDGKTIRPNHLEMIWAVYGLLGTPFQRPVDSGLLNDLADWRNKLAHGEVTYVKFGRQKKVTDIVKTIDSINDLVEITLLAYEEYFRRQLYLR